MVDLTNVQFQLLMKRRFGVKLGGGQVPRLVPRRMSCLVHLRKQLMERSVGFIARTVSRMRRVGERDSSDTTPIIIAEYHAGKILVNRWKSLD